MSQGPTTQQQLWRPYDPTEDPRVCRSATLCQRDENNTRADQHARFAGDAWVPKGRDPMEVLRRLAAQDKANAEAAGR